MANKEGGKKKKLLIQLRSTGVKEDGSSTGYFKTTTKPTKATNPKNKEKLKLRKFDPRAWDAKRKRRGMHVLFVESKIKG